MSGFGCGCGCNGKPGGCSDREGMGLFGFAGIASSLGLGCDCQETDADGNCLDPDPCTTANTGSSSCTGPLGSCPGDTAALNAPVNSGNTYSTASGTPTVNVTVTNPSTGQSASSNIVATDLSNLGTQFAKIFGNIVAPQTTICRTPPAMAAMTTSSRNFVRASMPGRSQSGGVHSMPAHSARCAAGSPCWLCGRSSRARVRATA